MGCNCGFGGGVTGGGSGNLVGELTPPFMPYATGPHALDDSNMERDSGGAILHGRLFSENESPAAAVGVFYHAGDGLGSELDLAYMNGTLAAPTVVTEDNILASIKASGYDGAGQRYAGMIRFLVDGDVTEGVSVPSRFEVETVDEAGDPHIGLVVDMDAIVHVPEQIIVEKTSRRGLKALSIAAGLVAIDARDSDWYTLTVTENCTISAPTNPENGRAFMLRLKFNGLGAWTVGFVSDYHFSGDTPPVFDTTGDSFSYVGFVRNEDGDGWDAPGTPAGPFLYGA